MNLSFIFFVLFLTNFSSVGAAVVPQRAKATLFKNSILQKTIAATGLTSSLVFGIVNPSLAESPDNAIANVARVTYSLKYVDDSINQSGDAESVVSQIRLLMKNYKLKDNLRDSLSVVPSNKKDDAKTHAQNVIEDLSQIFEYFSDDIDNMSGKKTPPKEVLGFAQQAVKAAQGELNELIKLYPSEFAGPILSKVESEFKSD
jgi:hypothetical protein